MKQVLLHGLRLLLLSCAFLQSCNVYQDVAPASTKKSAGSKTNTGDTAATNPCPNCIPIRIPTTGSTGTGGGTVDPLSTGQVRNLAATDFPINASRHYVSGRVAKLSLSFAREKITTSATEVVQVRINRWGPFTTQGLVGTGLTDFVQENGTKFICPKNPAEITNERAYANVLSTTAIGDYATQFAVTSTNPATYANMKFLPQIVFEGEITSALPTISLDQITVPGNTFSGIYDGDKNFSGGIDAGEKPLVQDAQYIYVFCVGKKTSDTTYSWAIQEKKVFRATDLEKPKAPLAASSRTIAAWCVDTNNTNTTTLRQGYVAVEVGLSNGNGIAGIDPSIGLVLGSQQVASDITEPVIGPTQAISVKYIVLGGADTTTFRDDPLGEKLTTNDARATITTGELLDTPPANTPGAAPYPVQTTATLSDAIIPVTDRTTAPFIAMDRVTALNNLRKTTTKATIQFKTQAYNKLATNYQESALNNSLIRNYVGEPITESTAGDGSVKIAYEIAIKDRSITPSTSLSSVVFGQPFTNLLFQGWIAPPAMTGATFFRGVTPIFYNLDNRTLTAVDHGGTKTGASTCTK